MNLHPSLSTFFLVLALGWFPAPTRPVEIRTCPSLPISRRRQRQFIQGCQEIKEEEKSENGSKINSVAEIDT